MIIFEFDRLPISINKLYVNIPGQARRFLSAEGRSFHSDIEMGVIAQLQANLDYIQEVSTLQGKKLSIEITLSSSSWLLKDKKTIRRKDSTNLEKVLTDSIFKTISNNYTELDDSQIWSITILKEVSDKEKTTYTIRSLNN